MKRLLGLFVAVAILASATWGANCDLQCALGALSSCNHEVGTNPSKQAPSVQEKSDAMPAGHCEHMVHQELTQHARQSAPAPGSRFIASGACPHISCSIASALVSQLKKLQVAVVFARGSAPHWDLNPLCHADASTAAAVTFGPSPPLSLRI